MSWLLVFIKYNMRKFNTAARRDPERPYFGIPADQKGMKKKHWTSQKWARWPRKENTDPWERESAFFGTGFMWFIPELFELNEISDGSPGVFRTLLRDSMTIAWIEGISFSILVLFRMVMGNISIVYQKGRLDVSKNAQEPKKTAEANGQGMQLVGLMGWNEKCWVENKRETGEFAVLNYLWIAKYFYCFAKNIHFL